MDGTRKRLSPEYVEHRLRGPFPNRVDPWAEVGRYFHQIHLGMIGSLLSQIQILLLPLGYEAGRETSLFILEGREPDLYIKHEQTLQTSTNWDYRTAAEAIRAEAGVAVEISLPEQDAIHVRDIETGKLITVVEIVSPSNKTSQPDIEAYRSRRDNVIRQGVNVVEIDATRSVKRLLQDVLTRAYAYHVAVYLPGQTGRLIGINYAEPLKRVALPLRGEVIPMELQDAYDAAYRQASIAGQIYSDGGYTEDNLPFPTLLTEPQRREATQAVQAWIERLEQLKNASE